MAEHKLLKELKQGSLQNVYQVFRNIQFNII